MNKKKVIFNQDSEADNCRKEITPKLCKSNWTDNQILEQLTFTDVKIIVLGRKAKRKEGKRADYILRYTTNWEGALAIAQVEDNNRYGSYRFISCKCDLEQVLPKFLNFHFLTPEGLEEINCCSLGGAGRNKTLGLKKLEAIEVPVPEIEKQLEFVKTLNRLEELEKQQALRQKELDQLMPGTLGKAFKEEL